MAQKKTQVPTAKVKDVVHQDRNWVTQINTELNSGKNWNNQWGFMIEEKAPVKENSYDNQISQIEEKIKALDQKQFSTTNSVYGTGKSLEMFQDHKYDIMKNPDLRPLERKLPKGWKKTKWTPRMYLVMQHLILIMNGIRKRNDLYKYYLFFSNDQQI